MSVCVIFDMVEDVCVCVIRPNMYVMMFVVLVDECDYESERAKHERKRLKSRLNASLAERVAAELRSAYPHASLLPSSSANSDRYVPSIYCLPPYCCHVCMCVCVCVSHNIMT